jgi:hypothetical protein
MSNTEISNNTIPLNGEYDYSDFQSKFKEYIEKLKGECEKYKWHSNDVLELQKLHCSSKDYKYKLGCKRWSKKDGKLIVSE